MSPRIILALLGATAVQTSFADPLHAIADGAYQHHDSGWIFPLQVGEFTRVGAPQDLDGTSDAIAYYERIVKGRRTTATVNVYPPTSAATDATFEAPEAADEIDLDSAVLATAARAVLRSEGEHPTVTALYFVDTGPWIVKIQSVGAADAVPTGALDAFTRSQRWDSFSLAGNACTGTACVKKSGGRTEAVTSEQLQGSDCKVVADTCRRKDF